MITVTQSPLLEILNKLTDEEKLVILNLRSRAELSFTIQDKLKEYLTYNSIDGNVKRQSLRKELKSLSLVI